MKKTISFILAILMLIATLSTVNLSVYASDGYSMNTAKTSSTVLSPNGSKTSALTDSSDEAYYKITAPSDGKLTLSLYHDYYDSSWNMYNIKAFDSSTNKILDYTIAGNNTSTFTFGTYGVKSGEIVYLYIEGEYNYNNISYTLTSKFEQTNGEYETERNNLAEDADILTANASMSGCLTEFDKVDYYKLIATTDGKLTLTINHDYYDSTWDMYTITVIDTSTSKILQKTIAGNQIKKTFVPLGITKGDTILISIEAESNYHNIPYTLSNTFDTVNGNYETEHNDDISNADTIKLNSSISGSMTDYDSVDYYKFTATQSGKMKLTLNHNYYDSSWDMYEIAIICDGKDTEKFIASGSTINTYYSFNITKGKTYYIRISGEYNYTDLEYTLSNSLHTHSYTNTIVKPTYAAKGYTLHKCKCGYSYKTNYTNKLTVAKPSISKVTSPKSKQLKVTWGKKSYTGYQVQIATNSKFTKNKKSATIKSAKTVSRTFTSLKGKTKYYVRVRAYKTYNGKNYYSSWSTVKTGTTKK